MENQSEKYNIISIRNIDDEDYYFKVDNQGYMIGTGETRNFPKFMAELAVKHLVDKILVKKDPEGKLMANKGEREAVASQIIVGEQKYEKPPIPTDEQIVEEMNKSEIDNILEKHKERLKTYQPVAPPKPDLEELDKPPEVEVRPEEFEGLGAPNRQDLLNFAKNILRLDITDKKTLESWDRLTDAELAKELNFE